VFCTFKKFGLFFEALTYDWDSVFPVKELSVVSNVYWTVHHCNS